MQSTNYAAPLHDLILDLFRGFRVRVNRYHHQHVEAFLKTNLVTRDGQCWALTRNGRECALWLSSL